MLVHECNYDDVEKLEAIGRLRFEVWQDEHSIALELFPDKVWIDAMDKRDTARHWYVENDNGEMVAAARLTIHSETDDYRDVKLWRDKGVALTFPVSDLGRLVVRKDARRQGIATMLNSIRVRVAREWGAHAIICTASASNGALLKRHHSFVELGHTIVFDDRPNTTFHAIHLIL
jgi:predicted GNAT family N-acyltransferase